MAEIIGSAYKELISLVERYAKADRPVLLLGDTGSGKELFAGHFMKNSKRGGQRRTVSCAEFSESLLPDEIFGHTKGAFTGAVSARKGLLRTCDKGILFLDELDKSSKELQYAVLRVAEGYSFRQVGSEKEITDNNTLIIAAASRLYRIHEQLVYRFHVLAIPPLQKFDIPALAEHFLGKHLKDDVCALLMHREYPGNVRELKKFCGRLKIEKDKNFFSGSQKQRHDADHPFDYKRFYDEYLLWQEYIVPIIDKHQLDIRYEFQQGSDECPQSVLADTIRFLKVLRHGSDKPEKVEAFNHALWSHIKKLELPNLLGEIYREWKAPISRDIRGRADLVLPKFKIQAHGHQGDDAGEFPADEKDELPSQLQELFKMPFGDARKKFSELYLEHALRKSDYDLESVAKDMGLLKKGLETCLRRHGMKRKSE